MGTYGDVIINLHIIFDIEISVALCQKAFKCPFVFETVLLTSILQLPKSVLSDILTEVVLQEGDKAYIALALVCSSFRHIVSADMFRRRAHFL